jgi:hypothetical protein
MGSIHVYMARVMRDAPDQQVQGEAELHFTVLLININNLASMRRNIVLFLL